MSSGRQIGSRLEGPRLELEATPLHDLLDRAAGSHGARPWLSEGETILSYSEGVAAVAAMASRLAQLGISRGDRVAVLMPNSIAFAIIAFACWRQDFILVGLNHIYSDEMLAQLVDDARPAILVTSDLGDLPVRARTLTEQSGTNLLVVDATARLLQRQGFDVTIASAPDPSLAALQYTGGTTGLPKGAMLSHRNISICVAQICEGMRDFREAREKFIALGPFSHVIGTTLTLALATALAAEIVIPERFDAEKTTEFILDQEITTIFAVPTIFAAIAKSRAAKKGDWSGLTYALCGGAPLAANDKTAFEAVTGVRLHQGYGCSETASAAVFTAGTRAVPPGSIGQPIADCSIEIIGPDGAPLQPGETGEIVVTGPNVMEGYWQGSLPVIEPISRSFATGDCGYIDKGHVFIVDRLKDMIIASGFNVYPARVERVVQAHPAIAEVAVVGKPDPYRGETVKAVAILNPGMTLTLEELQQFAGKRLSPLEMPRILECVVDLPRTPIGKVDKKRLRA
ncbi:class I adenylate-forming enzyme family protein [Sphingopyxis sp.]|jgi:long-chain acyl-CoA synthetase|uniref:class I adenylate-forming enzyme family protein n=1 Tax=Sphingopyxis sp. TaxID=1908224 RepID=UPI002E08AE83|nr:AMP-binding protein [Sphingopyxis sp.]